MPQLYDLLIIGGGINGCSIARDAAGRGLSVCLCEMGDFANATSSWSSKLIHGGIRYLENFEFKLVKESLQEREILMRSAPFLTHPLEFILPHESHLRPAWMIRIGLFLYDNLSKRTLIPGSKQLNLSKMNTSLKTSFKTGFSYYDCQTDDSRLTLLMGLDAERHGAQLHTYTRCNALTHNTNQWTATLTNQLSQSTMTAHAKMVINATGPWADLFNQTIAKTHTTPSLKLVQGSHIIVPKLYDAPYAYILQNEDKRIVFAIPYQHDYTLIGTTDTEFSGDPKTCHITNHEIDYLCHIINHYFKQSISPTEVIWQYAGVRALYDNHTGTAQTTTRDYHLDLKSNTHPPYLTIFGGKLTTSRKLAEDVMNTISPYFNHLGNQWTTTATLPGSDPELKTLEEYISSMKAKYNWLPQALLNRYVNAYGNRTEELLANCYRLSDLGEHFAVDLYEKEIKFWQTHEHAKTVDDMLWRRSKLGLKLTAAECDKLAHWLNAL